MEHRTTVVELSIEPFDLFVIVQNWAREPEFSLFEKNGNRTLYTKNIFGAKAWLSVEHHENTAKVEVWQSAKNVGPDFKANLWSGAKMPLPKGPVIGPNGVYKKQVHALFDLLGSKSKRISIGESQAKETQPQPTLNQSAFSKGLLFFGLFSLIGGGISVVSAISLVRESSFLSLANTMLIDGVWDMIRGTVSIACSRALTKGKVLGIWLYGAAVLMDTAYNVVTGQAPNYIFLGLSLWFIWHMVRMKKEWELS